MRKIFCRLCRTGSICWQRRVKCGDVWSGIIILYWTIRGKSSVFSRKGLCSALLPCLVLIRRIESHLGIGGKQPKWICGNFYCTSRHFSKQIAALMVTAAFVMIVSEILRSSVGTLSLVKRIRGFGEAGVCGYQVSGRWKSVCILCTRETFCGILKQVTVKIKYRAKVCGEKVFCRVKH